MTTNAEMTGKVNVATTDKELHELIAKEMETVQGGVKAFVITKSVDKSSPLFF